MKTSEISETNKMISLNVIVMTIIIVAGSLFTAGVMKLLGYKELATDWNPISVFIRSHGYIFLLLPFIWGLSSLFIITEDDESELASLLASMGPLLLIGLICFFTYSIFWCRVA